MKRTILFLLATSIFTFASSQKIFNKYSGNPIFTKGNEVWEEWRVADPFILYENGIYKMWYAGCEYYRDTWRIGYATSEDGINWTRFDENPILNIGKEGDPDDLSVRHPVILKKEDQYHMWYESRGEETGYAICYAVSDDGIIWEKNENNPVMTRDMSYEKNRIVPCSILDNGDELLLWYYSEEARLIPDVKLFNCLATSTDGITWIRENNNPLEIPVESQYKGSKVHVNYENNFYHMYYYFSPDLKENESFAPYKYYWPSYFAHTISSDGIAWEAELNDTIITAPYYSWDSNKWVWETRSGGAFNSYGSSRVIKNQDRYQMWYSIRDAIGYAASDLPEYNESYFKGSFIEDTAGCEHLDLYYNPKDSIELQFQLFIPDNYEGDKNYPLVIALHGTGSFGTDNYDQLHRPYIQWLIAEQNQERFPCLVLAPQENGFEQRYNLYDLLAQVKKHVRYDTTRVYLVGKSWGGYRGSLLAEDYPELVAAAVLFAGSFPEQSENLVPHWILIGIHDLDVPVTTLRDIVDTYFSRGMNFRITNSYSRYNGKMSKEIQQILIDTQQDYIYTEYNNSDHPSIEYDAFAESLVMEWMFSKRKQVENAITLTYPMESSRISGLDSIRWNSSFPKDSLDIWLTYDNGNTWQRIAKSIPNTGFYGWDTEEYPDGGAVNLKLLVKDSTGLVFGSCISESFLVDNVGNSAPQIFIDPKPFYKKLKFELGDSVEIDLFTADAESDSLILEFQYSNDHGKNYSSFKTLKIRNNRSRKNFSIDLENLEFSWQAILKVSVSDGEKYAEDSTLIFINSTLLSANYRFEFDYQSFSDGMEIGTIETGTWFNDKILAFDFLTDSPKGLFDIDGSSGSIILKNKSAIEQSRYYFRITASCENCNSTYIDTALVRLNVLAVSTPEEKSNESFLIYPNPASGIFKLKIKDQKSEELKLSIYNLMGQEQKNIYYDNLVPGKNEFEIDLSAMKPGVYIIKMEGDKTEIAKLIIQ